MCGITGYYQLANSSFTPDLRQMNTVISHRGPDDEGYYIGKRVGLAMRRLSIIDLVTGNQPMHNETSTLQVVFNGEIYNYRQLREELTAEGHVFTSSSDTEVLVHGYETWGQELPCHLRGMFAYAIWDESQERLLIGRDHFGIKPLFYAIHNETLLFGSEIKALLTAPGISKELDHLALDQYLCAQYVPEPHTIFQHIKALPAAHQLSIERTGQWDIKPYWTFVPLQNPYSSPAAAIEAIQEVVSDSVKHMLVADVPLGAFLSGGIDSASVVAMMKRHSDGSPVRTFSIGFGAREYRWDELDAAQGIADYFGTEHQAFRVEPNVVELLPTLVQSFDQPFANPTAILLYILSRETRQHVTVALSGTGGDEMFGGYVRYRGMQVYEQYARLPEGVRVMAAGVGSRLIRDKADGNLRTRRLRRFLESGAKSFDNAYISIMSLLDEERRLKLYSRDLYAQTSTAATWGFVRELLAFEGGHHRLDQLMVAELGSYLPFNQLAYNDRMSMAASLELRVPLVDQRVVEVAGNIPLEWKIQKGVTKSLFREAMKPFLPPNILQSPKQGLNLPLALWFQHDLLAWVQELLSPERVKQRGYFQPESVQELIQVHQSGKRDNSLLLWSLIVLEVWQQRYVD